MASRQNSFQKAINLGHSAAWDQDWERAVAYYRQALEIIPDQPQALTNLGLALYEMQDYPQALNYYLQAIKITPNDPIPVEKAAEIYERMGNLEKGCEALLQAAELYARSRELEKAIECWARITRLEPEHLVAHSRLALVYERMERKPQAVAEYLAVASLFQASGDEQRAVQAVQQAMKVMPDSPKVGQALAMIKNRQQLPKPTRPKGATGPIAMAQVRQLEPPSEDTQTANLDPISEGRQKALTVLASVLFEAAEDGEGSGAARRGLNSLVRGAATGSLEGASTVDHTRVLLHVTQVIEYQTRGNDKDAANELEKAIEAGLDHPAGYFDLGLLQAQVGDRLETALRNLQKSKKSPDFVLAASLLMGKTYRSMGRLQEASLEYLEALKIADSRLAPPSQANELRQLYEPLIEIQQRETDAKVQQRLCDNVRDLLERADWQKQIRQARQQLPEQPMGMPPLPLAEILTAASSSHVVQSIARMRQYAQSGWWRAAMEEAFWTIQQAPSYLPLHSYMADLLIQQGFIREAIAKLNVVARAYSMRGDNKQSIDILKRIIELAPMDLAARNRLIEQLIALHEYELAIQQHLELATVYYNLAELDMARKTYTEGLRLTQKPTVSSVWKVKILHQMADIDMQSLDWRQALRVYEQIRTLQPDDRKARHWLVELHLRLGQQAQALAELDSYLALLAQSREFEPAIGLLEELCEERPDQIPLLYRLGELYRQVGRNEESISLLDTVAEMMLNNGDKAGAIRAVQSILKMNPPEAEKYRQFLQELNG
ncbi:MAG: hypothetical protein OHK0052_09360 [Anaerolineales bacterium]